MNDKKKVISDLIENAKAYAEMADRATTFERGTGYSLTSIAYSLLCIVEMFNTDYTKTFGGDDE